MKCRTVYRYICEHLDEQSQAKRFRGVRRHLSECLHCQQVLDEMKTTVQLYEAQPKEDVPAATHRKLMAALKQEQQASKA